MKTLIRSCLILAVLASPVFADDLFFEAGPGLFESRGSQVFLLRYGKDTSKLFGLPSRYQAVIAYWNGREHDTAIGAARSVSFNIGQEQFITPSLGFFVLRERTGNLGTSIQFYIRAGYDFKISDRELSLAVMHISNGKAIFGWDGPNTGENFLTLSVGLF